MPDDDRPRPDLPRLDDPARLRALAHPIRLRLIEELRDLGEATATDCARRVGESVASCSFHLRQLEKYGYVERAGRVGRNKPWRLVSTNITSRGSHDVPGSMTAVVELARTQLAHNLDAAHAAIDRSVDEPQDWVDATMISTSGVWLTPDEARDLSRRILRLVDEYDDRRTDPARRPAGARRMRYASALHLDDAPSDSPAPSGPGATIDPGPTTGRHAPSDQHAPSDGEER
ncbi:regulatory protein, ArsR [Actinomycetales bacterium JB111]|nr:regulatory protein, ArsR [Actinomycetales bacterium JB111]